MSSKQFKHSREKLGLNQEELAEVLGFSGKTAISNIETGVRSPGKLAMAVIELLASLPKKDAEKLIGLLRKYVTKAKETDA